MMKSSIAALGLVVGCIFASGCAVDDGDLDAANGEGDEDVVDVVEEGLTAHCSTWAYTTMSLPNKRDLTVAARVCIDVSDAKSYVRGRTDLKWYPNSSSSGPMTGKKFDVFSLSTYLNFAHYDALDELVTCDRTSTVNASWSGSTSCTTPWKRRNSRSGGWNTKMGLVYNIDGDGQGYNSGWDDRLRSPRLSSR